MIKLFTSLKKLIGRLKSMLSTILQIGAMCIPLGFTIFFFGYQLEGSRYYVSCIFGAVLIAFGFYAVWKSFDLARIEDRESQAKFMTIITQLVRLHKDLENTNNSIVTLLDEIKRDRENKTIHQSKNPPSSRKLPN